ncbi:MAG: glutamine amidotransferase, partial [Planctomycetaceae bacterium]
MIFSALLIGDRAWLWPAVVITCAVLAALWWAYRRVGLAARVRTAAMLLKAAGLVLLAACLVDPLWSGTRARPGANLVLVLADNSASLTVKDSGSELSRGEQVRQIVGDKRWQARLAQDFDVRRYVVDA